MCAIISALPIACRTSRLDVIVGSLAIESRTEQSIHITILSHLKLDLATTSRAIRASRATIAVIVPIISFRKAQSDSPTVILFCAFHHHESGTLRIIPTPLQHTPTYLPVLIRLCMSTAKCHIQKLTLPNPIRHSMGRFCPQLPCRSMATNTVLSLRKAIETMSP